MTKNKETKKAAKRTTKRKLSLKVKDLAPVRAPWYSTAWGCGGADVTAYCYGEE